MQTTLTRQVLLIVIAVLLFIVAFLIAVDAVDGNLAAWETGGLIAFAASFIP